MQMPKNLKVGHWLSQYSLREKKTHMLHLWHIHLHLAQSYGK